MKIIELSCWGDPGFIENGVEVPSYNSVVNENLPDPMYTWTEEDFVPGVNRIFSQLKIRSTFEFAKNINYLKLVLNYNNNTEDVTYYGWVESVDVLSDTEGYPNVTINWHVDLWRTYFAQVTFGYGMIRSRPNSGDRPQQDMPYRHLEEPNFIQIVGDTEAKDFNWYDSLPAKVVWLILSMVIEEDNNTDTKVGWTAIPLILLKTSAGYRPITPNNPVVNPPIYIDQSVISGSQLNYITKTNRVAYGDVLVDLGLSTKSVTGAWLSTRCPCDVELKNNNNENYSYILKDSSGNAMPYRNVNGRYIFFMDSAMSPVVFEDSLHQYYSTTEEHTYGIMNNRAEKVWESPIFLRFSDYKYYINVSPTTCSLELFFGNDIVDMAKANQQGMHASVPLQSYPFASNSWSDYVISGQREAVREQRKIAQQQSLVNGVIGAGTSGVQGAGMGVITGNSPLGLGALNLGVGVASAVGGYATTGYFNDKLNKLSDQVAARQIDSLGVAGDSFDWMTLTEGKVYLVFQNKDEYSRKQFSRQLSLNGVEVSEPTANCTVLCRGSGPLSIENLIVYGSVPVEAKQYIKQRFNDGVRLI